MQPQYFGQTEVPMDARPLAARIGDFVFYAGGIAAHPFEGIPQETKAKKGYPHHGSGIDRQLRYIYDHMSRTLKSAGSDIRRVMKINTYQTRYEEIDSALRVRKDYFGEESPPPSTLVIVPETAVRGTTVTNDVIALASDTGLDREVIHYSSEETPLPPQDQIYGHPIYVQAVRGGGFIFTQGKSPTRAEGAIDEVFEHPDFPYRGNPVKFQTEFILTYFKAVLEGQGASLDSVVKAEVYLNHMSDFSAMDEVWHRFFPKDPPARLVAPVGLAVIPGRVEIELIAVDPQGLYQKEVVLAPDVTQPLGAEVQAIKAGPLLFLSTQLATDYRGGIPPEAQVDARFPFHSSGIQRQVEYMLRNIQGICREANTSMSNLVRRRAMHTNLADFPFAEEVWAEALGSRLPPTTVIRVDGPLLVPGCTVQYDLIVAIPDGNRG